MDKLSVFETVSRLGSGAKEEPAHQRQEASDSLDDVCRKGMRQVTLQRSKRARFQWLYAGWMINVCSEKDSYFCQKQRRTASSYKKCAKTTQANKYYVWIMIVIIVPIPSI